MPATQASPSTVARAVATERRTPLRLDYLDGLRGLSALYVVLQHLAHDVRWVHPNAGYPRLLLKSLVLMDFGHYAVDVFIVLSGFCLMLPVARSAEGALKGGVAGYLKRRARRILPPYYVALLLSLLLNAVARRYAYGPPPFSAFRVPPDTSAPNLLTHLLLLHNLLPDYALAINGPMWSVATEWQIYFLFPAVLLPVWRRWGIGWAVAAGAAVGMAPYCAFGKALLPAAPWFLGLFALGMLGAVVAYGRDERCERLRHAPWWQTGAFALAAFLYISLVRHGQVDSVRWAVDFLIGLATTALLIECSRRPGALPRRVLESRPAVALGRYSYSLYLIHVPALAVIDCGVLRLGLPPVVQLAAMFLVVTPALCGVAYLFHLAFEKRFMTAPARSGT